MTSVTGADDVTFTFDSHLTALYHTREAGNFGTVFRIIKRDSSQGARNGATLNVRFLQHDPSLIHEHQLIERHDLKIDARIRRSATDGTLTTETPTVLGTSSSNGGDHYSCTSTTHAASSSKLDKAKYTLRCVCEPQCQVCLHIWAVTEELESVNKKALGRSKKDRITRDETTAAIRYPLTLHTRSDGPNLFLFWSPHSFAIELEGYGYLPPAVWQHESKRFHMCELEQQARATAGSRTMYAADGEDNLLHNLSDYDPTLSPMTETQDNMYWTHGNSVHAHSRSNCAPWQLPSSTTSSDPERHFGSGSCPPVHSLPSPPLPPLLGVDNFSSSSSFPLPSPFQLSPTSNFSSPSSQQLQQQQQHAPLPTQPVSVLHTVGAAEPAPVASPPSLLSLHHLEQVAADMQHVIDQQQEQLQRLQSIIQTMRSPGLQSRSVTYPRPSPAYYSDNILSNSQQYSNGKDESARK